MNGISSTVSINVPLLIKFCTSPDCGETSDVLIRILNFKELANLIQFAVLPAYIKSSSPTSPADRFNSLIASSSIVTSAG